MKKMHYLRYFLPFFAFLLFLAGCSKKQAAGVSVHAAASAETDAAALNQVSVTLPEGMTRQTVSNMQHDFIMDGVQAGGIVIVDISDELLDAPLENSLSITELLGEQLMPEADSEYTAFMAAGGNAYAYMEVYTGGEQIQYVHYLFRGEENDYDVWFAYNLVDEETIGSVLASVSSEDITAELNQSVI